MRIAVAQIDCRVGDAESNLAKIAQDCASAHELGAELIVFPETADVGYDLKTISEVSTTHWDQTVARLQESARKNEISLICGVVELERGALYNTALFIDRHGVIQGKYRKAHLFAAGQFNEAECFSPGDALTVIGEGDFAFGLTICYDIRFPELYRALAGKKKANVLVISAAWPFPRLHHLRALAVARAIENQCYVLLANRTGFDADVRFCGASAIIDPYGVVVASAWEDREELIFGNLSLETIDLVRQRMPVGMHRRDDLY